MKETMLVLFDAANCRDSIDMTMTCEIRQPLTSTVPEPHFAAQLPPEKEIQLRTPPDGTEPTATLGFRSTDI